MLHRKIWEDWNSRKFKIMYIWHLRLENTPERLMKGSDQMINFYCSGDTKPKLLRWLPRVKMFNVFQQVFIYRVKLKSILQRVCQKRRFERQICLPCERVVKTRTRIKMSKILTKSYIICCVKFFYYGVKFKTMLRHTCQNRPFKTGKFLISRTLCKISGVRS